MGWLLLETGQKDNDVKFFQNFRGFYDDELKASNTCFARKNWGFGPADTFAVEVAVRNAMLQAQKKLKEAVQKGGLVVESDNEHEDEPYLRPAELPKVAFTFLDPNLVPETPAQMARRLACESGAAWDQQQYNMIVLCISPLQQVWDFATQANRLGEWDLPEGRLTLIRDSGVSPMRIFGHGAGGSGKTFCLTQVVLPTYDWFMPGQCRRQASQNAAARLIEGETMHARAGLTKNAKFTLEEPSRKLKDKLKNAWGQAVLVYNDEVGAAAPGLYGTLSSRAYWGKRAAGQVEDVGPQKAPFGDPLLHVDAGDFAQLRPVPRGSPSLMEAFLMDRDEYKKEQRVRPLTDMERLGLKTFDLVAANCVEFQGTYRFKPKDPLLKLLQIMRTVGGARVPESLRRQVLSRVQLGSEDPRIKPTYRFPSSVLGEKASTNNFCNGMFSAVNWEQVARMQQISAARNARTSLGPVAWQNSTTGQPQYLWQTFCPYLNRTAWGIAAVVAKSLGRQLGPPGQLLFFAQRVDRAHVQQHAHDQDASVGKWKFPKLKPC